MWPQKDSYFDLHQIFGLVKRTDASVVYSEGCVNGSIAAEVLVALNRKRGGFSVATDKKWLIKQAAAAVTKGPQKSS